MGDKMKVMVSLLCMILFLNNSFAQKKNLPEELVNRSWSKTVTIQNGQEIQYKIYFKPDSTFRLTNQTTNFTVTQKLQFENNHVTFPGGGDFKEIGKYRFTVHGDTLAIHSEGDASSVRRHTLEGNWKTTGKAGK